MVKGIISDPQLKKYAELAVRAGVNLQKDQLLIINSDIQHAGFARLIQTAAYEAGASNVVIDWKDEQSSKEFYIHAADRFIDHIPDWQAARFKEWNDEGAAYIHIISDNVLEDVSAERIQRFQKASRTKLKDYYSKVRSHKVRWCLIAVPCVDWAAKVFPNLSKEEALQSLWELIVSGARADGESPIDDWREHHRAFESRKKFLNESRFEALHFTNKRGTDLVVGLAKNHLFIGGAVTDEQGIPFFPNIPTEEIFTAPHKNRVNGKLVGTKPLIYGGNIIEDFHLIFTEGRITDYYAANGQEALQHLIETDEGSHYLREIALVSTKVPLAQANTLFYKTLFDENTACHIGIGDASPSTIIDGLHKSEHELKDAGLNSSLLSVNVTFGADDMNVVGVKEGREIPVMEGGDFKF